MEFVIAGFVLVSLIGLEPIVAKPNLHAQTTAVDVEFVIVESVLVI